jgi:CBS domain-containing protein/ribosome-associated translation inhibitor RaiA
MNSVELNIKASSLMTPNPIMVRGEDKTAGAKNLMIRNKIDHLPVVEDKKPLAILTSSHLIEVLIPPERPGMRTPKQKGLMGNLNFEVKGIADKEVVSVDISDSIRHVIDIMNDRSSSYTLVTLSEEVQGIITVRDLTTLMQEMVKDEIPAYIVGLPEDPVDAELAKSKFLSTLQLLRKSHPNILEARCRIKIKDDRGERRRYEVDMHLITPKENVTYVDVGWDLANIFDNLSNSLKRHLDKSAKYKKGKRSIRYASEKEYTE